MWREENRRTRRKTLGLKKPMRKPLSKLLLCFLKYSLDFSRMFFFQEQYFDAKSMPSQKDRSFCRGDVQKHAINIVKIRLFYIWVVSGTFEVFAVRQTVGWCARMYRIMTTQKDLSNFKLRRKHKTIAWKIIITALIYSEFIWYLLFNEREKPML